MANNKCTICGKDIVLKPSAAERAKKYGRTPGFYLALFTEHGECVVAKRTADTLDLMRRIQKKGA